MRLLGAFLLVCGFLAAVGYKLYCCFSAAAESMPLPLKIAIAAAAVGFLLMLISIGRERYRASKEEKFTEVKR